MTLRYVCTHGHFYQPPRENPWIEVIERQDSAYPYHDWNERITAECYAPNASSRILDDEERIVRIVNNYSRISFNFGPTLLKWLEDEEPRVYEAVLEADRESAERFGGHGSAMAQVYNHMIMPLASERDRRTQVVWGIRDFQHRFGRDPEGMWLAETAVDTATLETLAAEDIRFTVLAPGQASSVRRPGEEKWRDVSGGRVDPTRPYTVPLPSGREIDVFFYDGGLARAVAFEGLLKDGARFAERLLGAFPDDRPDDEPLLVNFATDGETYGHHHSHGEMALSYALREIEEHDEVRLTNYAEYLERHPPQWEARIVENTSWSCAHGVERWRSDCGCHTGGDPGWSQDWRAPLRDALDWLHGRLEPVHEEKAGEIFRDPWAARDDYIDVILDRDDPSLDRFFEEHARDGTDPASRVRALRLLEIQRHAMLMYTSCGWFFNEVSGIETVQVLQYAGRAVQLAEEFGERVERGFLERLERAVSNLPSKGNGRRLYEEAVLPARVDLEKVGAHYAVSSLFEEYGDEERVYCYRVRREEVDVEETGTARLARGRIRVSSIITRETAHLSYGVVHLGGHTVVGGVRVFQGEGRFRELGDELDKAFERADFPAVIRLLDGAFRASIHSLRSLLGDEQRRVLERILEDQLAEAESTYARLHTSTAPLLRFLKDLRMPPPRPFRMSAEYTLNLRLRRALESTVPDVEEARSVLEETERLGVEVDAPTVGYVAGNALERVAVRLLEAPESLQRLDEAAETTDVVLALPAEVSLWGMQNRFWEARERTYPAMRARAADGDPEAAAWVEAFRSLGERIRVAVDETYGRDPASDAREPAEVAGE